MANYNLETQLLARGWPRRLVRKRLAGEKFTISDARHVPYWSRWKVYFRCSSCEKNTFSTVNSLAAKKNDLAFKPICLKCGHAQSQKTDAKRQQMRDAGLGRRIPRKVIAKIAKAVSAFYADPKNAVKVSKLHSKRQRNPDLEYKYDLIYKFPQYRRLMFQRDHNKCAHILCSSPERELHLHHIDYSGKSSHKNLIVLCEKCHRSHHAKARYHPKTAKLEREMFTLIVRENNSKFKQLEKMMEIEQLFRGQK